MQLGVHFWPPDVTAGQARSKLADYIRDLEKYRVSELENFCSRWRLDATKKKFPMIGEVVAHLDDHRRHVTAMAEKDKRGPVTSRPLMWWHRPKSRWDAGWRETDVPAGQKIRDVDGGALRDPNRGYG